MEWGNQVTAQYWSPAAQYSLHMQAWCKIQQYKIVLNGGGAWVTHLRLHNQLSQSKQLLETCYSGQVMVRCLQHLMLTHEDDDFYKIIHSILIFAILSLSLVLSRRLQLFIYLWWTSQKKYFIFDKRKLIGSRRMGKSDSPQLDWSLECGLMCDLGMWGTTWHQAEKNHKDLFFAPRWCWHDNSHLFVNCD